MDIESIFNVFSFRNKKSELSEISIPRELRINIIRYCNEVFSNKQNQLSQGDYSHEFWLEIHEMLLYQTGQCQLNEKTREILDPMNDTWHFLLDCSGKEFLDFIESIFKVKCMFHVTFDENRIVDDLNRLMDVADVAFELSPMVKESRVEKVDGIFGRMGPTEVVRTIAFPQINDKSSSIIYESAIRPTIELISNPNYQQVNTEFLEALNHIRKGEYGDSLTKCCSAFESTIKTICHMNRWKYQQEDTAHKLIAIMIEKMKLDASLTQPLMIIATIRNKYSKSHGAGVQKRVVSRNLAQYTVNLTASAIVFLINEAGS